MNGGGYFLEMIRTLLALAGVCVFAWVTLRFLSQRGFGTSAASKHLRVVERVTLEPRRNLYVVHVDDRRLLIGVGEGDAPRLITELSPHEPDLPVGSTDE